MKARCRFAAPFALLVAACSTTIIKGSLPNPDAQQAPAADGSAAPPVDVAAINLPFKNLTDVKSWIDKFERESREIYARRVDIADAVELRPTMRIADVGAGTGLFEPYFSLLVGPAGKVYAVDIAPLFLEHIRGRALADGNVNVETILCDDDWTHLPATSVDAVFLCDTYHHFERPQKNLASIHSALVPGGKLVVVDFEKDPAKSSDFIMKHVRAPKSVVTSEITAAGFELVKEVPLLKENYVLIFRRSN